MKDLSQKELASLLYAESESIRINALREIRARQSDEALDALHEALRDTAPSSFFCLLAEAIAAFGSHRSFSALRDAYHRTLPDFVRVVLLRAIVALKSRESEALLRQIASGKSETLKIVALSGLASLEVQDISELLLDAFVTSPLHDEVAALLLHAPDDTIKALVLRLMFTESIPEELAKTATTLFGQRSEASAEPLIRSWAAQYSALRPLCRRVLRKISANL
jgi:hypothetical protein